MKIKFVDGDDITIELTENTIIEIKNIIAKEKDIAIENIKLIYNDNRIFTRNICIRYKYSI